jgi:ketosteroid isomerase-like protein
VLETRPNTIAAVQRFYAAFTAQDLDGLLETVDPGVVFVPVLGPLYTEHVYCGHQGITEWYGELAAGWDAFEAHVDELHELGGTVIAFVTLVAHRGDRTLDAKIAVECRFRNGRIHRLRGRDLYETAEDLGVQLVAA